MSFNFKLSWVQVLITLFIAGFYLTNALSLAEASQLTDEALRGLVVKAVIAMVVLQIIIITVVSIINSKDAERGDDERDKLIKLYGDQAGYTCVMALITVIMIMLWAEKLDRVIPPNFHSLSDASNMLHLVFLSYLFAEVAKNARQLWCYYRG